MRKSILFFKELIKIVIFNQNIEIFGPFGSSKIKILKGLKLELKTNKLIVYQVEDFKKDKAANLGLFIALLKNLITGVTQKFSKTLKISGSGYKFLIINNTVSLFVGKTKTIKFIIPDNLHVSLNETSLLTISGINKEQVGLFTSLLRSVKPIEPYKARGISYLHEQILKKEGKKIKK